MASAIVSAIASVIGYLAAKGVDTILAKWVAYFTIAWDKAASQKARDLVRVQTDQVRDGLAEKFDDWKKWRDGLKKEGGGNAAS